MYIKTVKVTNVKNVMVQIPKAIVDSWGLTDTDSVEVYFEETELRIRPRKGFAVVRPGSRPAEAV